MAMKMGKQKQGNGNREMKMAIKLGNRDIIWKSYGIRIASTKLRTFQLQGKNVKQGNQGKEELTGGNGKSKQM